MRSLFLQTLRGMDTPFQWASGMALGVLAGFLPWHSLLPFLVIAFLIVSGANMLTGAGGYLLGSLVARPMASISEQIGFDLLTRADLQSLFVTINEAPLFVWIDLSNSLVAGSVATGSLIGLTVFVVAMILGRRLRLSLDRIFSRYRLTAWLSDSTIKGNSAQGVA